MAWLLDTNQWIQLLQGRCRALERRLDKVNPASVWLCAVVKEEHRILKSLVGWMDCRWKTGRCRRQKPEGRSMRGLAT